VLTDGDTYTHTDTHTKVKTVYPPVSLHSLGRYNNGCAVHVYRIFMYECVCGGGTGFQFIDRKFASAYVPTYLFTYTCAYRVGQKKVGQYV